MISADKKHGEVSILPDWPFHNFTASISRDWRNMCSSGTLRGVLGSSKVVKGTVGSSSRPVHCNNYQSVRSLNSAHASPGKNVANTHRCSLERETTFSSIFHERCQHFIRFVVDVFVCVVVIVVRKKRPVLP